MFISQVKLKNWKNFRAAEATLGERVFIIGPNACGKSNFLDIFRFMRDIVKKGGGLEKAVEDRGGALKIRCLAAREEPEVELEFHFTGSLAPKAPVIFKYILAFKAETRGKRRTLITREEVWKEEKKILARPDKNDKSDEERLTQANLEQISVNKEFRAIYDYFNSTRYLHVVPQLLRYPEMFFGMKVSADDDAFGFHFIENIHDKPEKTRSAWLGKIQEALKAAVPQLQDLDIYKDNRGVPHLQATYEHWRPPGSKHEEKEFSDGTIRLIAFLWSILENNSLLLLEEPEISLNSYIVSQFPELIHRVTSKKKKKQQILLSTHSPDLLSSDGIGAEEVLLLKPGKEGTVIVPFQEISEIQPLLKSGMNVAEAGLPLTRPENLQHLGLFK